MDMRAYYDDVNRIAVDLKAKNPSGIVHVTSIFNRDRNSTAGQTLSATVRNAARVIADGTHREATADEIKGFEKHQQIERVKNQKAEQKNKQQYIVVVDQKATPSELVSVAADGEEDED